MFGLGKAKELDPGTEKFEYIFMNDTYIWANMATDSFRVLRADVETVSLIQVGLNMRIKLIGRGTELASFAFHDYKFSCELQEWLLQRITHGKERLS